jgi:hypothetical protein
MLIADITGAEGQGSMKYRPHRGGLAEAMAECVELPATMEALRSHVECESDPLAPRITGVEPYGMGPDERIGWKDTCVVFGEWGDGSKGVVGFTDEMPT